MKIFKKVIRKIRRLFILRFRYGLIFCYNREIVQNINKKFERNIVNNGTIIITQCNNPKVIFNFYQKNVWDINLNAFEEWISEGNICWVTKINDKIICSSWSFFNTIVLTGLSGRAFSKNRRIHLDKNTLYMCHGLTDTEYRGKGLLTQLQAVQLKSHFFKEGYDKCVCTMGADNISSIRAQTKLGAKIIVIALLVQLLGFQLSKFIFQDNKEIIWK